MPKDLKQGSPVFRVADFRPETMDVEKRTVEVVWTTGARVFRSPWFSEPYYEELAVDEQSIRLDRLNNGAPLLDTHGTWSLKDQIGVVERAWIKDGKGHALVRFSERAEVEPVFQDVKNGIIRNISVGYRTYKYIEVPKGESDKYSTFRCIDWEPFELSFVPVPADAESQVRSQGSEQHDIEIIRSESGTNERGQEPMSTKAAAASQSTETQTPAAAPVATPTVDEAAIRKAAAEAERARSEGILEACEKAGLEDSFARNLIKEGTELDVARKLVIDEFAKRGAKEVGGNQVRIEAGGQDEIKTRREAAELALVHRFDPKRELTEPARRFRGMSLVRMAEEILGDRARGLTPSEIAQRALGTSDFPIILANVAGNTLRAAYQVQPKTFTKWARQGNLSNYKAASRVQIGSASSLVEVPEHGEYQYGTFGEAGEEIQLAKYGRIIRITEQLIVNDDLDALTRIPWMLGNAAARLESKLVYDVLLNNAAMSDSVALFHATHGNLGSAAAINETSMAAARKAIRSQKDLDSNDPLDLQPSFLLVGPDKEVEAQKLLSALLVATKSTDVNVFAGSMEPVVESRITGNKWFVVCSPNQIDTVEIAYLDGMAGPQVTTKDDFDSDGVAVKIKHVVGVKAIDHRGMFYNPGA